MHVCDQLLMPDSQLCLVTLKEISKGWLSKKVYKPAMLVQLKLTCFGCSNGKLWIEISLVGLLGRLLAM
ncbi:MAG: hypothetical protein CML60_07180 [Rhodobacteraceae bacterium]|nr:hypothetical protein [Paracoccaceae bacterium]